MSKPRKVHERWIDFVQFLCHYPGILGSHEKAVII